MTSILKVNSIKQKSDDTVIYENQTLKNTTVHSSVVFPEGHYIQCKTIRSNYDWGSVGNADPWAIDWLDLTLTTKGAYSWFHIIGRLSTDDTNSNSYGVGMGCMYSLDGGTNFTYIHYPAKHEDYNSGSSDTYKVAMLNRIITTDDINVDAGTEIVFRLMARCNNSNMQRFLGNGVPYYGQEHTVMEIAQ